MERTMTHTLVTIAVPAAQMADANAAMAQITGSPADAQTFRALEWALTKDAETGLAVCSGLFEVATAEALGAWQAPAMVRLDLDAQDAIADMGLVPWVDSDAPVPVVVDYDLLEWRETAVLTRREFCLGLVAAGVLPLADAVSVGKGDWPLSMDAFLSFLDEQQGLQAQIEWATASIIERNNTFVLSLASWLSMPTADVDTLFGYRRRAA